jgi:hypothetical protein
VIGTYPDSKKSKENIPDTLWAGLPPEIDIKEKKKPMMW